MQVLVVTVDIKPGHKEEFIKSMLDDARGSVQNEPGCLRFDVVQDSKDPNRIYLYEAYKDQAAIDAHRKMPHYLKWRETVKDWFARPADAGQCTNIFPTDRDWGKDWKK